MSCEMSCAFLRPIFLRAFVAGRCPARGPAVSCAPFLSAHVLQDAVLQLPALHFDRHVRCRTLSCSFLRPICIGTCAAGPSPRPRPRQKGSVFIVMRTPNDKHHSCLSESDRHELLLVVGFLQLLCYTDKDHGTCTHICLSPRPARCSHGLRRPHFYRHMRCRTLSCSFLSPVFSAHALQDAALQLPAPHFYRHMRCRTLSCAPSLSAHALEDAVLQR